MAAITYAPLTNHHHRESILSRLVGTLELWRRRSRERAELAKITERDLHDIGVSRCDVLFEMRKPFWRG
jgi:uncharacterized protein YjiS (DUF1127 family)